MEPSLTSLSSSSENLAEVKIIDVNDGPIYFNRYPPSSSPTFAIHPFATSNMDGGYWWGHKTYSYLMYFLYSYEINKANMIFK